MGIFHELYSTCSSFRASYYEILVARATLFILTVGDCTGNLTKTILYLTNTNVNYLQVSKRTAIRPKSTPHIRSSL
jgi:hypothetical protein